MNLQDIFDLLKSKGQMQKEEDVLNVYPYGSRVYGTDNERSDYDFIVVMKSAFLQGGAFKQNAISCEDRKLQLVLYSRTGFIDAINNFEIAALECLSLPDEKVLLKKWPFKIQKWDEKALAKSIITKASNSWLIASRQSVDGMKLAAKKGIFHALRILDFGLQLKENQRIDNFKSVNFLKKEFEETVDEKFDTRDYIPTRDDLIKMLRNETI